jgi:hypothetical protein
MMKTDGELSAENTATIIELGNRRKRGFLSQVASERVSVMVEVACDDAIGEDIKICLTKALEESGCVTVSDDRPDWVCSTIAFHQWNLVELSVVIRQFFRSTAPGTEIAISDSSGEAVRGKGHWVYESLKYHGLHGVPRSDLESFLKGLAKEFIRQHVGVPQNRKIQT